MDDLFFTLLRYSLVGIGVSIGGLIYSFVKKSSETPNLRLDLATRLAFFFTLILSSSFFIFSIIGMDSQKNTPPLEPPPIIQDDRSMRKIDSRRESFQAWLSNLQANLEIFDARWQNLWNDSIGGFNAGTVSLQTVYHNSQILQIEMERLQDRIENSKPPQNLTPNQQKKLNKALKNFDEMIKLRIEACEDLQYYIDHDKLTTEKRDKILEKLYKSNEFIQKATVEISEVRLELGM